MELSLVECTRRFVCGTFLEATTRNYIVYIYIYTSERVRTTNTLTKPEHTRTHKHTPLTDPYTHTLRERESTCHVIGYELALVTLRDKH